MAIVKYGKLRREQKNSNGFVQKKMEKTTSFSEVMNSQVQKSGEGTTEYIVTMYGRDMKLSPMQYRTREYHY